MLFKIDHLVSSCLIAATYVLCHGLTAWIVTPLQSYFMADVTVFASLIYLPHGVRILSVWMFGWRAAIPLAVGALLSEWLFTAGTILDMMQSVLLMSIAVGVLSAYAAFEVVRLFGSALRFSKSGQMLWRQLLVVGALASVFNSLGQTVVFSSFASTYEELVLIAVYFIGDFIGQIVSMLALMYLFRTLRRRSSHSAV